VFFVVYNGAFVMFGYLSKTRVQYYIIYHIKLVIYIELNGPSRRSFSTVGLQKKGWGANFEWCVCVVYWWFCDVWLSSKKSRTTFTI
jgi:hypothetical protein